MSGANETSEIPGDWLTHGKKELWTMYKQFMKLVESNAEELTKNILSEVRKKDEFRHYRGISEDVFFERISQVIRNVYERLGNWLDKNKTKNTLFAYYSDLGGQRFREGIPLDEVIHVTFKIPLVTLFTVVL